MAGGVPRRPGSTGLSPAFASGPFGLTGRPDGLLGPVSDPPGDRSHGEEPGRLGPRHRPVRPQGTEARAGRDARPGRGRGVRLRRIPQDPQPARRRPRGAGLRGAGDLPRPQRPEGLQGRDRRARPGRPGQVHQASAGREEADSRHRQVRGQVSRSPSPSKRSSGPTSRSATRTRRTRKKSSPRSRSACSR